MNSFSSLFIWRWGEPHILLYGEVSSKTRVVSYMLNIYSTHFTLVIKSNYPHSPQPDSIFYCTWEHVMVWLLLWFLFTIIIYMELVYTVWFQQKHRWIYPKACSIYLFYGGGLHCKMANQHRLLSNTLCLCFVLSDRNIFFLSTDLCKKNMECI